MQEPREHGVLPIAKIWQILAGSFACRRHHGGRLRLPPCPPVGKGYGSSLIESSGTTQLTVNKAEQTTAPDAPSGASSVAANSITLNTVTGSGRETRAVRNGRFILVRKAETIYAAELLEANAGWAYGMTEDEVRAAFSLITAEWTAGDN